MPVLARSRLRPAIRRPSESQESASEATGSLPQSVPVGPLRFEVAGKPLSINAAYRVVRLGKRAGLAKTFEAKDYQRRVALAARKAMLGRPLMDGALVVELVAYWPRRNADSDAATKLTKDALQGVVFVNDRVVVEDRSRKAHDPVRPRVEVLVYPDGERPRDLVNAWHEVHEGPA